MVRKIIGGIMIVIAVAAIGLGASLQGMIGRVGGNYENADIYSITKGSYASTANVTIGVDLVIDHANMPPFGEYYLVGSRYSTEGEDTVRFMMLVASDPKSIEKLNALHAQFDMNAATLNYGDPVELSGYIGQLQESAKVNMISGFESEGMSPTEARSFFDENIMPYMFAEESAMGGIIDGFGLVAIGGGVVMLIIAIVLLISAKNANKQFNPYGGYVHPNARGDFERPLPKRLDTSSLDNFSPSRSSADGGFRSPSGSSADGGFRSPSGRPGYQSPSGRPGYQSPSGRPGYQSPSGGYVSHNTPANAEPEVPFSPKKLSQPDYEDFFASTRKKKMLSADVIKPEGDIDSIVRNTHDDRDAVIGEVTNMKAVDEQAEALPVKNTDESPVADLIEVSADDEIVASSLKLLDFDNVSDKSGGTSSDSGLSKRADFWSKWELDDGDVRPDTDLPDFLGAGLDELGAVDVIRPSESFGTLREAPPEPDEMDYFTPAADVKNFDMSLDDYLNTNFLNHEESAGSGVWVDEKEDEDEE
jgi:hypothetical protein